MSGDRINPIRQQMIGNAIGDRTPQQQLQSSRDSRVDSRTSMANKESHLESNFQQRTMYIRDFHLADGEVISEPGLLQSQYRLRPSGMIGMTGRIYFGNFNSYSIGNNINNSHAKSRIKYARLSLAPTQSPRAPHGRQNQQQDQHGGDDTTAKY